MSTDEERISRQIDAEPTRTPRLGAVARCPECGSTALVRESLTVVSCRHCGEWSRA